MLHAKHASHLARFLPIVIDVETGGVRFQTDALLEIAAIPLVYDNVQGWSAAPALHYHVQPFKGSRLDPEAMAIHGIDPDHPFRGAISEAAMCDALTAGLKPHLEACDCTRGILVGHNAHFDLNFLMAAAQRCQKKLPMHSFTCFDTATMGAFWVGETVLARILAKVGISFSAEQAHSALYDAQITAQLTCLWLNQRLNLPKISS